MVFMVQQLALRLFLKYRRNSSLQHLIKIALIFYCNLLFSGVMFAADANQRPGIQDGEGYGRAKAEDEEHLQPGQERKREVAGVPALFSTPETGWGGGGAFIYLGPQKGARRDFGLVGASYTQRKQFLSIGYFESYNSAETWAWEASYRLTNYPDYFFGIGRDTDLSNKELYTMASKDFGLGMRVLLLKRLQVGLGFRQEVTTFNDFDPEGFIGKELVPGALGGKSRFGILSLRYDTVDDIFSARKGVWFKWDLKRDNRSFGGDFDSTKQIFNLSYFIPVLPTGSLGMQSYLEFTQGLAPWYQYAQAGGRNLLRGYFMGQYRDRNMAVVQTEWRQDIAGPWGWVAFTGAGQVADDLSGLGSKNILASSGAGIRYRLTEQQRVNVRLDFGWSRDNGNTPSTYLYILEAF
jgi:outer membrane protein assembly factor BamA